jgi:hypothetical protein
MLFCSPPLNQAAGADIAQLDFQPRASSDLLKSSVSGHA